MPRLRIIQETGAANALRAELDLNSAELVELEGDRLELIHDALWVVDCALRQEDGTLERLFGGGEGDEVRLPRTGLDLVSRPRE